MTGGRAKALFLTVVLFATPSWAVLNGSRVPASEVPYIGFSQTVQNEIFDCSGVFVSPNTMLTAAHCFDELTEKCESLTSCRHQEKNVFRLRRSSKVALQIKGQTPVAAYTLMIHPLYKAKNYGAENTQQSNYDLALVVFNKGLGRSYLPVATQPPEAGDFFISYGTGMSELTLFSQPETDTVYNLEDGIGELKRARFSVKTGIGGELLQAQTLLIGKQVNRTNFTMKPVNGGQVLGSDSGGPLVKAGKVVAITRNYELSFVTDDLGKVQRGLKKTSYMKGKSVFTALHTKKNRQFLLSVQKYGGKVYFN